jgi:hypothetical protein
VTDVKLETPNGVIELPVVEGSEVPSGLDISKLLSSTGQDRDVAAVVWDALVGSLLAQGIVVAAVGLPVLLLAGLGGRPRPAGRPAYPLG